MTDIDLAPFLGLRRHLKIAHHVPGRVRLRVSANVFKEFGSFDTKVFDRILGAIDGIKDVRVNAIAGSVVIAYAPSKIKSVWWETLLQGAEEEARSLLKRLLDGELSAAVAAARQT